MACVSKEHKLLKLPMSLLGERQIRPNSKQSPFVKGIRHHMDSENKLELRMSSWYAHKSELTKIHTPR